MNLEDIRPYLLYKFRSESELVDSIKEMSEKFTIKRESIEDYVKDEKLVSAYASFYFTTNHVKLKASFEKLSLDLNQYKNCEFIDIGTGPGTFLSALLEQDPSLDVKGIEKSELMIKQAKLLLKNIHKQDIEVFSHLDGLKQKTKKRFGIFGHSANEMSLSLVIKFIRKLDLDHVLFLEPGTKDFFSKSLEIRKELIERDFSILYPCPSTASCPMAESDWCHQYLKVEHSQSVERLTQLAKKDRKYLPMTIHFYSKEDDKSERIEDTVSRVYKPTKFSTEWQICRKVESENKLFDIQIMNRGLKKQEIKIRQEVLSGDKVEVEFEKKLTETKYRGRTNETRE